MDTVSMSSWWLRPSYFLQRGANWSQQPVSVLVGSDGGHSFRRQEHMCFQPHPPLGHNFRYVDNSINKLSYIVSISSWRLQCSYWSLYFLACCTLLGMPHRRLSSTFLFPLCFIQACCGHFQKSLSASLYTERETTTWHLFRDTGGSCCSAFQLDWASTRHCRFSWTMESIRSTSWATSSTRTTTTITTTLNSSNNSYQNYN